MCGCGVYHLPCTNMQQSNIRTIQLEVLGQELNAECEGGQSRVRWMDPAPSQLIYILSVVSQCTVLPHYGEKSLKPDYSYETNETNSHQPLGRLHKRRDTRPAPHSTPTHEMRSRGSI